MNPSETQINLHYLNKISEDLSKAHRNDVTPQELKEELRIIYKVYKESNLITNVVNESTPVTIINNIYQKGFQNIFPQICIMYILAYIR